MTNEEIIKGLQAVNEHIGKHFNEGGAWMAEFIDEAIKALEQQPCEDAISRIKAIENFADWYGHDYNNQGYYRLLKQMPSVTPSYNSIKTELKPCEDCVSREEVNDLLDELIRTISDEINYRPRERSSMAILHDISNLPSVKPQPKRGKWKRVVDKTGHWVWECDDCEWQQRFATNYCPDCGADMEVKKYEDG